MLRLKFNFKFWLENELDESIFGEKKYELLKTINDLSSLKESLEAQNLSYRKTWNNINKIEEQLGFHVIDRQRGGIDGGKTTLTPEGKLLVEAFDNLHLKLDKFISQALDEAAEDLNIKLDMLNNK